MPKKVVAQKKKGTPKKKEANQDRCTCTVNLDPKGGIKFVSSDAGSATFEPRYSANMEPKCAPTPPCTEPSVVYEWTISDRSSTDIKLMNENDKQVKVVGLNNLSSFKLCVKVTVRCRKTIGGTKNLTFSITTRCEDSACEHFDVSP